MRGRKAGWVWGAAVAAVAVIAVVVFVVVRNRNDDNPAAYEDSPRLDQAVTLAAVDVDGVKSSDVKAMITTLCRTQDGNALATMVVRLGVEDHGDVRRLVEGVGRGATGYCPEVPAAKPQLVNDAYNAALGLLAQKG